MVYGASRVLQRISSEGPCGSRPKGVDKTTVQQLPVCSPGASSIRFWVAFRPPTVVVSPGQFDNNLQLIARIYAEGHLSGVILFRKPQSARALSRPEIELGRIRSLNSKGDRVSYRIGGIACAT
jgi:hypothetical protein